MPQTKEDCHVSHSQYDSKARLRVDIGPFVGAKLWALLESLQRIYVPLAHQKY